MEHKEYQQRDYQQNILHDDKEAYENLDKKRRRDNIIFRYRKVQVVYKTDAYQQNGEECKNYPA